MFPKHIFDKLCELIEYVHIWHTKFWKMVELQLVKEERAAEAHYPAVPQDVSVQPLVLDYQDRKHVFLYNPTNAPIVLTSEQGGEWSTQIPAYGWANCSFPPGTRLKASVANTVIKAKSTDEVIP